MTTIENIEKELKENRLNSIYLLYGEETYLIETMVKRIKKTFGELVKGINEIEIDEKNLTQLISNIETPAFGYDKKLIIVKNTGLFKREVKKKGADFSDLRDRINEFLKTNIQMVQQGMVLVFIEESVDKGKLLTTFEELNAVICNFEFQKPNVILSRIKAICNAYHVNVEDSVLRYFIEAVGVNMQDIMNEIRKQIEYAGENGTITKENIDSLANKQIESIIFDLTDNLGKRNLQKAHIVLKNLIYTKEPLQKILITLYHHFKKLYKVKLAIRQNRNLTQAMDLKPNQTFLITKYKAQSQYFKEEELKEMLNKLIDLDANYKVGNIDLAVGLDAILCQYCS